MSYSIKKKDWLIPIVAGLIIGLVIVSKKTWYDTLSESQSANISSYADIIEPVLPFTVSIFTNKQILRDVPAGLADDPYFAKYFSHDQHQTSLGSGIVLTKTGIVVTNAHVIRGADQIVVLTHTGETASVKRTLIDPQTDIAILETNLVLSADLPISTDQNDRVGDLVFSIGNPFGIGQSVSMGVISATGRQQPGLTTLTDFIQTDAAINPGNSGGALINAKGKVIGMNTAIFSSTGGYQGIGFAIPFAHVKAVAEELLENGLVTRGYLGIDVVTLTQEEKITYALPKEGLKIISVDKNSPADLAGLKSGDILLSINHYPLTSRNEAARFITQLMPGKKTTIKIIRDGIQIEKSALLSQRN